MTRLDFDPGDDRSTTRAEYEQTRRILRLYNNLHPGEAMTATELDYNDQCDLAFGRLRRLVDKEPELYEHLDVLSAVDLGIDGLGLSGEQGAAVVQQILAEKAERTRHADSIESAWGVIANATDWDRDDRKEWRTAAEQWRDRNGKGAPPEATPE